MTADAIALGIFCQFCLAAGQVLMKHTMTATHGIPLPWGKILAFGAVGTTLLTFWFLIWLGLLRDWELSLLFPFEGLSVPLLVLAARIFLGERVGLRGWTGVAMISVGVALVARS